MPKERFSPAFTLVEVAIALGIFGFAIIALVGLLSVGLQTEKDAHRDTVMGNMVSYVLTDLRGTKYSVVTSQTLAASPPSFSRWYQFDADGAFVLSGTTATPVTQTNAVFLCTAQGSQVASPKHMQVAATIEYPLVAPAANREKEIFVTTLTPYEAPKQ